MFKRNLKVSNFPSQQWHLISPRTNIRMHIFTHKRLVHYNLRKHTIQTAEHRLVSTCFLLSKGCYVLGSEKTWFFGSFEVEHIAQYYECTRNAFKRKNNETCVLWLNWVLDCLSAALLIRYQWQKIYIEQGTKIYFYTPALDNNQKLMKPLIFNNPGLFLLRRWWRKKLSWQQQPRLCGMICIYVQYTHFGTCSCWWLAVDLSTLRACTHDALAVESTWFNYKPTSQFFN